MARFTKLELLVLDGASFQAQAVGRLSSLPPIKTLHLVRTIGTPDGNLKPLYAIKQLETLRISYTQIKDDELLGLAEALPNTRILVDEVLAEPETTAAK